MEKKSVHKFVDAISESQCLVFNNQSLFKNVTDAVFKSTVILNVDGNTPVGALNSEIGDQRF